MKKIGSLTVLKFVAMLLIVWWHLGNPTRNIDLGARMCEFLFVASGFLVGYNYYMKGMSDSRKYSFDYTFGKIKKAWPLHVVALIILICLNYKKYVLGFTLKDLPILLSNLFLLQAWSPDVENVVFSYNGVSWFLSALLFCYFVSPLFIKFIRKIKVSIIIFFIVATTRVLIDLLILKTVNIFSLSTHSSPIIRSLEFFMGMLTVPLFLQIKNKTNKIENRTWFKFTATFVELTILIACYFIMRRFNGVWRRSYFVLMFCIMVCVFALDCGYLSKICSNKYVSAIAGIQLEMYLLQLVASAIIDKLFAIIGIELGILWLFSIKVILLFVISFGYKYLAEKHFAKFLSRFYENLKKKCFG